MDGIPHTGKKLWRRYTIPAPGEPGSETWPKDMPDAWKYGGGVDRQRQEPRERHNVRDGATISTSIVSLARSTGRMSAARSGLEHGIIAPLIANGVLITRSGRPV